MDEQQNDNQREFIASSDWTKNWHASITVKITAIALWPTIVIVFIGAYFILEGLEQRVMQDYTDISFEISHHVSNLWPHENIEFTEKIEKLREGYQQLHLPGFELTNNGKIYSIGKLKILPTYIDLPISTLDKAGTSIEIRTFFPDAKQSAELLRNKIIGAILLSLMLFGLFLSLATHIILNKPLRVLVDATQKISEGQLQIRLDTVRQDEFGTLSRFFNKMVDNLVQQEDLEQAAKTDFLTGIANRRHFDDAISYELKRNARTKTPLTLIMCDVDYFKQYNDLYNHVAGDLCLKHIARTLESVFNRTGDLVARYGGEEFVIILPNTDAETGTAMANTLREEILALKISHSKSEVSQYVTLSAGVTSLEIIKKNYPASELIEAADEALYKAKQNGRNRVEVSISTPQNTVDINSRRSGK